MAFKNSTENDAYTKRRISKFPFQQIIIAYILGCFIISPFLKLEMLGVSSGGILVTIKEKKISFDRALFRGRPAPSKFEISYHGKICWKSTISFKRNEIESSARYLNMRNGRLPISSQYIFCR